LVHRTALSTFKMFLVIACQGFSTKRVVHVRISGHNTPRSRSRIVNSIRISWSTWTAFQSYLPR